MVTPIPTPSTIAGDERFTARLAGDFASRCVQLAKENHLDGTARLERMGSNTLVWTVPSRNRSAEYTVCADHSGAVWCTCRAAQHHKACSHSGAVFHALRQLAEATHSYVN